MGVQLGQAAALYCRVSTADQTCARQERDLRAFVKKAGYKSLGSGRKPPPGQKQERAEREKILALAQARKAATHAGRPPGFYPKRHHSIFPPIPDGL